MSIESNLKDLDFELGNLEPSQREEIVATLAGIARMVSASSALPASFNEALESTVMGLVVKAKMRGQAKVLAEVLETASRLSHVGEIVRRLMART